MQDTEFQRRSTQQEKTKQMHRQAVPPKRPPQKEQRRMRRNKKARRQPPSPQRPLSPEAERLRQKRLRAKMRKRRRRRRLLMVFTTFALIAACIVVCCKLLFQVNGIRLEIGEEKFHYVLPAQESSDPSSDSAAPPDESAQLADPQSESAAASEPQQDTQSTPPDETAQSADPQSESAAASEPQQDAQSTQPEATAQPTQQPEIMHQGAKEVPAEQPIAQTGYTVGSIAELLQVYAGQNLLEMDLQQMIQTVEQQCPYLENVKIYYKLPNTLVVSASIAVPTFCVQVENEWAVLSANKKVVEHSPTQPEGLMVIAPGKVTADVGTPLIFAPDPEPVDEAAILSQTNLTEEERLQQLEKEKAETQASAEEDATTRQKHLEQMLSLFEKWEIRQDVTQVDVSDSMQLQFWYQGRVLVKLGTENEMSYKIQFAARILTQELSVSDQGTLDASAIQESGELRPVFSRSVQ